MSERKSDTLRQREKAQKDLLELKKIQQGQLDAEVLKKDEKKIPMTLGEKVSNFFFHHKWKVVTAVCAAFILGVIIHSEVTKVRYDTILTLYSFEYYTEENVENIGKWMAKYYPDTNENGKTEISVQNCSYLLDVSNQGYIKDMQKKIQSLFLNDDALMYILDEDSLYYLKNETAISSDIFPEEYIVPLPDEYAGLIKDNKTFDKNRKRYLCLINSGDKKLNAEEQKNYEAAKAVIEKFRKTAN